MGSEIQQPAATESKAMIAKSYVLTNKIICVCQQNGCEYNTQYLDISLFSC
jgi:hypothetical protein